MSSLREWFAARVARRSRVDRDAAWVRSRVVDANDGVIATAGVVEGFIGAGASSRTVLIAAFIALLSGAVALGGVQYAEAASERDAESALLEEERRQLELSPEEELAELASLYESRGVSPELAQQVARELTAWDALAAHAEVEHGLTLPAMRRTLLSTATGAGLAFVGGGAIPTLGAVLAPPSLRLWLTAGAVFVALCGTSLILARAGVTQIRRTLARTIAIAVFAMTITLASGAMFAAVIEGSS